LEGTKDERDVREIDLDATTAPAFRKFLENVTERRLRQTEPLRQFTTVQDFRDHLKEPDLVVTKERVVEKLSSAITELKQRSGSGLPNDLVPPDQISFDYLVEIERLLILAERKNRRRQQFLLAELEPPEPSDAKTEEAARLFASQRYRFPYYFSFDALCQAANGNVEQFLAIASPYVDKMIFRAELGRAPVLNAGEQEELLRQSADRYYQRIEQGFAHGFNIRQFIDNLGIFCKTVTHRPNAPIAPGVTGFGLTREQLRDALSADGAQEGLRIFRQTLTSAVAGNVLAVRSTKQGQAGSKKLVFYLNRLLCIRFGLPMNYGGWQRLPIENLVKMMRGPVPAEEWGKKWKPEALTLEEAEV
jgi:hypothetical protein